ncbi:hypothetical protein HRbin23_00208 [bacterium HR23]|nr:hypothetical protein HRbin23_00208 [bacterium HR23]
MLLWGQWRRGHPRAELLSCYLDNQVSARERRRIAEHLAGCAPCREVLADLRRVSQWIKALPAEEPSRPLRIRPVPAHPAPRLALPQWAVPSAVAVGLLLVVVVATDLSLGMQARQGAPLPPPGASATQPGQAPVILAPDIPKEAGQPPPAPVGTAPAPPQVPSRPRPLLHWVALEGVLAGVLLLFLALLPVVRRRTT